MTALRFRSKPFTQGVLREAAHCQVCLGLRSGRNHLMATADLVHGQEDAHQDSPTPHRPGGGSISNPSWAAEADTTNGTAPSRSSLGATPTFDAMDQQSPIADREASLVLSGKGWRVVWIDTSSFKGLRSVKSTFGVGTGVVRIATNTV